MVRMFDNIGLLRPLLAVFLFVSITSCSGGVKKRTVEVSYSFEASGVPVKAKSIKVWVPYPLDSEGQSILDMEINAPSSYEITRDSEWGNSIVYFKPSATDGKFAFSMRFVVEREEIRNKDFTYSQAETIDEGAFSRYLKPGAFAVHDDRVRRFAAEAIGGKTTIVEKARGIYDFTLKNMAYDKSVPGWGSGDVNRICLSIGEGRKGSGNCTDFHSLFSSLMQVSGVPVVFEMGFPLAEAKGEKKTVEGGYHCWARFFAPDLGWVPVDISEASKEPSKTHYYFGSIDENRILFSRGRDVLLTPPQSFERLNFFGPDPYIEVDGKPFNGFKREISYIDVAVGQASRLSRDLKNKEAHTP